MHDRTPRAPAMPFRIHAPGPTLAPNKVVANRQFLSRRLSKPVTMSIRPIQPLHFANSPTFAFHRLLRTLRRLHPDISSSLLVERLRRERLLGIACSNPNNACEPDNRLTESVQPAAEPRLAPLELDWPSKQAQSTEQPLHVIIIQQPVPTIMGRLFDLLV